MAYANKYKITMADTAATALQKIQSNPANITFSGLTATTPAGNTFTFPDQTALDKFKTANGISTGWW